MGSQFHIVWSVDEAYALLGAGPIVSESPPGEPVFRYGKCSQSGMVSGRFRYLRIVFRSQPVSPLMARPLPFQLFDLLHVSPP
jgi:hypothetical protein